MRKSIFEIDKPKDCLSCKMRRVIQVGNDFYQLCGLDYTHGWKCEAFFKGENLKNDWISPECPLQDSENYIYNSEIYEEVTSIGYIAKHYDIDALYEYSENETTNK